jgi:hypothetical protein
VREFDNYQRANVERIPHYSERRRAGEEISTAFTESTVSQVISKRMVQKQPNASDSARRPPATSDPNPGFGCEPAGRGARAPYALLCCVPILG